jgi:hypothetical protein
MFKVFSIAALLLLTTQAMTQDYSFIGKAYDLNSNELLYTEHHSYLSEFLHKVEYKEPNGEIFATKTINYEKGFFSPEFILKNKRNGEFISAKKNNQHVILEYKENENSSVEISEINDSDLLVIDAGFNHFITRNWDELISGKSLSVNYLIPSQGNSYELTLQQVKCDIEKDDNDLANTTGIKDIANNNEYFCFSISAASFFIRIFSSELQLTYKKNGKSNRYLLTSFKGRTNISDSKGDYQDAHIRYQF